MINKDTIVAILVLAVAVTGGYFLIEDQDTTPKSDPQIGQLAIEETVEFVSILDKIHPDKIKVISVEESEWPDSCLGLSQDGEMCAQAIVVQGYTITLDADGQTMVFRTDRDGSSIRRDLAAEANR